MWSSTPSSDGDTGSARSLRRPSRPIHALGIPPASTKVRAALRLGSRPRHVQGRWRRVRDCRGTSGKRAHRRENEGRAAAEGSSSETTWNRVPRSSRPSRTRTACIAIGPETGRGATRLAPTPQPCTSPRPIRERTGGSGQAVEGHRRRSPRSPGVADLGGALDRLRMRSRLGSDPNVGLRTAGCITDGHNWLSNPDVVVRNRTRLVCGGC
jgi:hypothetical protein